MSTTCSELLSWAETLLADKPACEVSVRASISRAYYACLHNSMETFAISEVTGASSHQAVIDGLARIAKAPGQGRSQAAQLAKLLPKLKRTRVEADYELERPLDAAVAERSLELAREMFAACGEAHRLRQQALPSTAAA